MPFFDAILVAPKNAAQRPTDFSGSAVDSNESDASFDDVIDRYLQRTRGDQHSGAERPSRDLDAEFSSRRAATENSTGPEEEPDQAETDAKRPEVASITELPAVRGVAAAEAVATSAAALPTDAGSNPPTGSRTNGAHSTSSRSQTLSHMRQSLGNGESAATAPVTQPAAGDANPAATAESKADLVRALENSARPVAARTVSVTSDAKPAANSLSVAKDVAPNITAAPVATTQLSVVAAETVKETGPPDAAAAKRVEPQSFDGISGAQQSEAMKKAHKTNNFTGLAEQKVPTAEAPANGEIVPVRVIPKLLTAVEKRPETSPAIAESAPVRVGSGNDAGALDAVAERWNSPLRSVERAQDLMALHAVRLRESTSDSLRVVIKPGADLQLSLQLSKSETGIDVRANLDRGDFNFLNRHWQELQQQLEARGVRVASLTSQGNQAGTGGDHFNQSKHHNQLEDSVSVSAPTMRARGSVAVAARASAPAGLARGFESWA